jgi:NtrC-family two-component system sensor histidine kinase KinB
MWQQNYRSILAAEKMMEAIERQDRAALLLILGREKEAPGQFHEYEITFLQWLARAKDNLTMYGFKKLIDYNNRLFIPLKTALSSYSNPI